MSTKRYTPINEEECEGRVAPIFKPNLGRGVEYMVVLSGGFTFANGGMQTDVGVSTSNILSPCAM